MGTLVFVCFVLAGIVLISIVRIQEKQSQIGEEGRETIRATGVRSLAGGVLLFAGSGAGIVYNHILQRTDVEIALILYIILATGILLMAVGRHILVKAKLEKETELVVTTLSDCRIIRQSVCWLHYYMLIGVSLEGRQNIFYIHGSDREMIKQAQAAGKKNFVIRYYKHSGRIYDII